MCELSQIIAFVMQNLGFQRFSLLGWSDGGISSMILASKYQKSVEKLVIWGVNAFVLDDDIKSYESNEIVVEKSTLQSPLSRNS